MLGNFSDKWEFFILVYNTPKISMKCHSMSCTSKVRRNAFSVIDVCDRKKAKIHYEYFSVMGSGCGSVGREVTSDTRDWRFKSRHWQNFIYQLYTRKDESKEKKSREWPIFNKKTQRRSTLHRTIVSDTSPMLRSLIWRKGNLILAARNPNNADCRSRI